MNTDWEDGESYFKLRLQIPDTTDEEMKTPHLVEACEMHSIPTPSDDSYRAELDESSPKVPFWILIIPIFFSIRKLLR